jgi:predicted porin
MKASAKARAALALAGAIATVPSARAQTSVTLYGRLDAGIEYLNHIDNGEGGSSSRWRAEGGNWGTSMLGLKGSEDLGGGLNAIFNLETGL